MEPGNYGANGIQYFRDLLSALVFGARPEETFEPITFAPRHNVHVKMRNALADAIVQGYERSVGLHATLDRYCEQLNIGEKRRDQSRRQITESFTMSFGDEQAMSGEQRAVIEKGQSVGVLKHAVGRRLAAHNSAEKTAFLEWEAR